MGFNEDKMKRSAINSKMDVYFDLPPPPLGSPLYYSPMRNAKAHRFGRGTIFKRYTNVHEV